MALRRRSFRPQGRPSDSGDPPRIDERKHVILYHFTAHELLRFILRDGLTKGDVPISRTDARNAVWLTNDRQPEGHGLSGAEEVEIPAAARALLRIPDNVPNKVRTLDKRAIRIAVKIPTADRNLVRWRDWSRKRVAAEWRAILDRAGGGKANSWFLYWGTIPPKSFVEVIELRPAAAPPVPF